MDIVKYRAIGDSKEADSVNNFVYKQFSCSYNRYESISVSNQKGKNLNTELKKKGSISIEIRAWINRAYSLGRIV